MFGGWVGDIKVGLLIAFTNQEECSKRTCRYFIFKKEQKVPQNGHHFSSQIRICQKNRKKVKTEKWKQTYKRERRVMVIVSSGRVNMQVN